MSEQVIQGLPDEEQKAQEGPTAVEVEQAMTHLAGLAALLESRSQNPIEQAMGAPHMPGLTEMLPQLLMPLRQFQSNRSDVAATSMASYRPLVSHVQALLTQLSTNLKDQTSTGLGTSVALAERIMSKQRAQKPTPELAAQLREKILRSRRQRRQLRDAPLQLAGQLDVTGAANDVGSIDNAQEGDKGLQVTMEIQQDDGDKSAGIDTENAPARVEPAAELETNDKVASRDTPQAVPQSDEQFAIS
ncbi:unnamed protein product [Parajaminaea phylloscopi]